MSIRDLVIYSQLNPPAQRQFVLHRPRITNALQKSLRYPITVIQAGTGYGKSTELLTFIHSIKKPVYWYSISGNDRDPILFLANLFSTFNQNGVTYGENALRILENSESHTEKEAMISLINSLSQSLKQDCVLILDDFHKVLGVDEIMTLVDWMIEHLPYRLHLIISTRRAVEFPSLNKWRVKGRINEITHDDMGFRLDEIALLFQQQYEFLLSDEEVVALKEKTEGWAIGLQMVWHSLQNSEKKSIIDILEDDTESRKALFGYLADEVLKNQSDKLREFLVRTSVLEQLNVNVCDFLLNTNDSEDVLVWLNENGLFVEELRPGLYRYHSMFLEFLRNRLMRDEELTLELHNKAASYFAASEIWERAIYHMLSAGNDQEVLQVLNKVGDKMIATGRHESVDYWLHEISSEILEDSAYANYLLGEINRYSSRFELALEHYHTAGRLYKLGEESRGQGMALRGQAQVYLDTLRPLKAVSLLQKAILLFDALEDTEIVADLLTSTAENSLNLGDSQRAEIYLAEAKKISSDVAADSDFIKARVLLRTGRLEEGIQLLETHEALRVKSDVSRPQRFHREGSVLLSLFYSMIGDQDKSRHYALLGAQLGESMDSTFVQSVSAMRLGHPLQIVNTMPWSMEGYERAIQNYQLAMEKVDVNRIHVEPLWGMCRAYGYSGRIGEAERLGMQALSVAGVSGDQWIGVLIQISLGASYALAGRFEEASKMLVDAELIANRVGDSFARCAAWMWLAINASHQGHQNTVLSYLGRLLPVVKEYHYEFLLLKETLLGLRDRASMIPLLILAQDHSIEMDFVHMLLRQANLNAIDYHPGYSLWVNTLGEFRVWRGQDMVQPNEWKREKAKQLLQLLVSNQGKWLHKDQIITTLWMDTPIDTASKNLKVVYNALNHVLEMERPKGKHPFFIERRHNMYGLNPDARILTDTTFFEKLSHSNDLNDMIQAVDLYRGAYFEGSAVQEYLVAETQYYQQQFLLVTEKLTNRLIELEQYDEALFYTMKILSEDNLWEPAYCLQMQIYAIMEKHAMVHSIYRQCKQTFDEQLGMAPSAKVERLYQKLVKQNP